MEQTQFNFPPSFPPARNLVIIKKPICVYFKKEKCWQYRLNQIKKIELKIQLHWLMTLYPSWVLLKSCAVKSWTDILTLCELLAFSIQGNPHTESSSPSHVKNLIVNHKCWLIHCMAVEKIRIWHFQNYSNMEFVWNLTSSTDVGKLHLSL